MEEELEGEEEEKLQDSAHLILPNLKPVPSDYAKSVLVVNDADGVDSVGHLQSSLYIDAETVTSEQSHAAGTLHKGDMLPFSPHPKLSSIEWKTALAVDSLLKTPIDKTVVRLTQSKVDTEKQKENELQHGNVEQQDDLEQDSPVTQVYDVYEEDTIEEQEDFNQLAGERAYVVSVKEEIPCTGQPIYRSQQIPLDTTDVFNTVRMLCPTSNQTPKWVSRTVSRKTGSSLLVNGPTEKNTSGTTGRSLNETSGTFPFQELPSGDLKVNKHMVVYANDRVAVLVTNPAKTKIHVRQEDVDSVCRDQDRLEIQTKLSVARNEDPKNSVSTGVIKSCQTVSSFEFNSRGRHRLRKEEEKQAQLLSSITSDLRYRLRRAIHPDTKVVIGSKDFPCHSILLQTYSKYFDALKRPPGTIHRIPIPEEVISTEDFPTLMDWILLDAELKHRVINRQNVIALYTAATSLVIPGLQEQCHSFINKKIETGDPIIIKMYHDARKKTKCRCLLKGLASKLSDLFPVLYKSRQFLELGAEDFIVLIDSDDLNIQRELDVFHAASRWLLHDWSNRHQYAVRLMRCVRFGLMSPLQLMQIRHCAEATSMTDYTNIFSFQEIQDMINDGLTYAIFKESYEHQPRELNKWIDWSKIHAPRRRLCLSSPTTLPTGTLIPKPNCSRNMGEDWKTISSERLKTENPRNCHSVESPSGLYSENPSASFPSGSSRNSCARRRSSIRDPFTLASVLRFKNK